MWVSTDPSDLAENRQGRLSQAQIAAYDRDRRDWVRVRAWLVPFLFASFLAAAAILGNSHAPAAIAAFVIIELALLVFFVWLMRRLSARARARVLAAGISCKVGRLTDFQRSKYGRHCYLRFGDDEVLGAPVDAIDRKRLEERPHRVYYVSRLGHIVGIESDPS